ncbi:hypothetical protein PUNSTDRAFT_120246 [Punctularia strigosozonata HHB-11173 SS5]|uniref:uncharacterized protein n=1 Tax=Punctularia strigosozonata (strain HHB-11173) TaxID=741275 RepID=UPI0004418425|nr:uncharacterized protein PUNSTDRAFT_120246 [Punctularia strigosozonata HHB-11173 SS5]EIN10028.1 hypothetical protein PUNSTDRAFT_120246 [Punctularia strigosozonata HHB-11173 SS5]
MAFASNSAFSGFGAKPAPATNIFGSTTQQQPQQPAFGSFGAPQQGQAAAPSLFGTQNTSQGTGGGLFGGQQSGTGLFGQTTQQSSTPSGGLFGQPTQQSNAPSGGLFGQSTQPANAPSSGLFGQSTTQQSNAPTGGLFGQSTAQQSGAPSGGLFGQNNQQSSTNAGGLFGQQQQQQPQQQNAFGSGSLFGSKPNTTQPSTSLFGQPQQQTGGLFGNTNSQANQPGQAAFGGFSSTNNTSGLSLFGQKPQTQQTLGVSALGQPQASQQAGAPPFLKNTKFNDLPDNVKKIFEGVESHIQGRVQISKELKERKVGDEATKGQELMWNTHQELLQATATLHQDTHFTRDLKAKVEQAVQDTIVATHIVDAFRSVSQPQSAGYLKVHAGFPLELFTRVTEQMRERLRWYKATIEQIERKISAAATNESQYTPQAISTTLQTQHATFIALANKTAILDAELQRLKQAYTQLWRARTGSMRDPFADGFGRDDVGIDTLGSVPGR